MELTSKIDEHAKYRKERHAELVQLQTAHDALVQASYEDIVSHIDVSDSTSTGAMVVSLMDIARPAKVKGTFKISCPCIH